MKIVLFLFPILLALTFSGPALASGKSEAPCSAAQLRRGCHVYEYDFRDSDEFVWHMTCCECNGYYCDGNRDDLVKLLRAWKIQDQSQFKN